MKYFTLVVSLLFTIGLCFSIYKNDYANAIVQAIIAMILFVYYLTFLNDDRNWKQFTRWLAEQEDLNNLKYNGIIIDDTTEFVQYEVCLSLFIFSLRRETGYYIKEYHPTPIMNLLYSSFTMIFGWWAFPTGPLNTLRSLKHNLLKKTKSIHDIRAELYM